MVASSLLGSSEERIKIFINSGYKLTLKRPEEVSTLTSSLSRLPHKKKIKTIQQTIKYKEVG